MNLLTVQHEDVSLVSTFDTSILLDRFIENIDAKINSKDTYRRQIKPFFEWLSSRYLMSELRSLCHLDVVAYKEDLIRSGKSSYTVNSYITVVRKFFEWMEAQKIFPNIAKSVKGLKRARGFRKECITVDQIKEAFSTFDVTTMEGLRDYALFNLLVRTGLRTYEVAHANVGDLRQQTGTAVLWIQGKGRDDKDDFVVLVDETLRPLRKYLSKRGPLTEKDSLFASISNRCSGEPIKERMIRGIIKDTFRKINIDDTRITAHSLRHTAISLAIAGGASLAQAQAMARHSDPKTTMIYFHNHDRVKSGAEHFIII